MNFLRIYSERRLRALSNDMPKRFFYLLLIFLYGKVQLFIKSEPKSEPKSELKSEPKSEPFQFAESIQKI